MDATGADFFKSIATIHDRLKANAVAIQLPIGSEDKFKGIIDLIEMTSKIHLDDLGKEIKEGDIPEEYKEQAREYRNKLVEACADFDEDIMVKYLEGEAVGSDEIKAAIRKGVVANEFIPVICGSSYKNKGVQEMIDAVVDYLPSPNDIPAIKGTLLDGEEAERHPMTTRPCRHWPSRSRLIHLSADWLSPESTRHYETGSYVLNSTKNKRERIGRLVKMHANHRQEVEDLRSGDIGAIVGLKDTTTGDTLAQTAIPSSWNP